jgi:hypothetical protein
LAGVALVLVVVRLGASRWLDATLERELAAALGREVRIESVGVSLWPAGLELGEGAIGGPPGLEGSDPRLALGFDRIALQLDLGALLRREIHLTRATLAGLSLRLERDAQGGFEPLVLASPAEPDAADGSEAGWPVRLDELALEDTQLVIARQGETALREVDLRLATITLGDLVFEGERVRVGELTLDGPSVQVHRSVTRAAEPAAAPAATVHPDAAPSPIGEHSIDALSIQQAELTWLWEDGEPLIASLDFAAREVSMSRAFPVALGLEVEGARLDVEGALTLAPLVFDGEIEWEGLRLPRLLEASGAELSGELVSGRTHGRVDVALTLGAEPAVTLVGEARIEDLEGTAPTAGGRLDVAEIVIARIHVPLDVDPQPPEIHLERVRLAAPVLRTERSGPASPAPDDTSPAVAAAPSIRVDEMEIESGDLTFVDPTLRRRFETRWRDVAFTGTGLRWPERDAASLQLRAKGPRGARLRLDGGLAGGEGRLTTRLDRLSLASLDPYAEAFTGLALEGGRLRLDATVDLGPTTQTKSLLQLQKAKLSEREDGWFERTIGMPLDVAVALLRDLEGNITLPIDAAIGPDESKLGLLALVAATLKHAVIGAVTSPLKLVGGLATAAGDVLGVGALAPIPSLPGVAEVARESEERLAALADTLEAKPGLRLLLRGGSDATDDPRLARQMVLEQARDGSLPEGHELGFFERRRVQRALAGVDVRAEPIGPDADSESVLAALASSLEVPEERRATLARARAAAVQRKLVEEHDVPSDAVRIDEATAGAAGIVVELTGRDDVEDAS